MTIQILHKVSKEEDTIKLISKSKIQAKPLDIFETLIDKNKEYLVKTNEESKNELTHSRHLSVEIFYNLCLYEKKKVFVLLFSFTCQLGKNY